MNLVLQKKISHIQEMKTPVNFVLIFEHDKYQIAQLHEKGQVQAAKLYIKDGMLFLTAKRNYFMQSKVCLELQNMAVQIVLNHPQGQGFICDSFEIYGINKDFMKQIRQLCIQSDFISNYEITKKLGSGSYAHVYQADCKYELGQYAVKVFDKHSSNISIVKREINILRNLSHQNIPQIREVFETTQFIYIIMDLIQGDSLHNIMPVSDKKCQVIMKQIFSTLKYLHNLDIIHRDLKPDNILIDKHDKIFIVDFGFAQFKNEKKILNNKFCGTPGFMAPELLKGQDFDHRIDVFAVGAIMYSLLTGQYLFIAKQTREIINLNLRCEFNFDKNIMISYQAKCLLSNILHVDQSQRFTSEQALNHSWIQNEQDIKVIFETIQTQLDEEQDWIPHNDSPQTQIIHRLCITGRGSITSF